MITELYDFKSLIPMWGTCNIFNLESFNIEPNDSVTKTKVSSDGWSNVSLSPDQSATVTITLNLLSDTNKYFAGVAQDMRDRGRLHKADLIWFDRSGAVPMVCEDMYLDTAATFDLQADLEGSNPSWVFRVPVIHYRNDGANLSQAQLDSLEDKTKSIISNFNLV